MYITMLRPLENLSLPRDTLESLIKNGFNYLEDIEKAPDSAKKFVDVNEIMKLSKAPMTISALDHWDREIHCERVTTFSKALDTLLDGGFHCGTITELCGVQGTGKTQICFQLCTTTQLPRDKGGLNGRVLYIDSRNGFSSRRLQDLSRGCKNDYPDLHIVEDNILAGVTIVSVRTAQELFSIIGRIKDHPRTNDQIRVVIIDSLSLPIVCSLDDVSLRHKFYTKILDKLQNLATGYNIAVIIVNELSTQLDSQGQICIASSGGQSVANRCQKRLMLARLNDTTFAAKILKSSTLPQVSKIFRITADGVRD